MLDSLSIIVPAYNVEDSIEIVLRDAQRVGSRVTKKLEIIVCDDGSRDATGRILKNIPVRRIVHQSNQGYGKTIKELYLAAKNEWIFSLPGDYQFEAKEIDKLLPLTRTHDMILGWRGRRHDPLHRLIQSKIYNTILFLVFGLDLHDANSIRVMKREIIQSVPLRSTTAFVDAELALRAKAKGFRIVEVPVLHRARTQPGATGGKLFTTILPTLYDMLKFRL